MLEFLKRLFLVFLVHLAKKAGSDPNEIMEILDDAKRNTNS